MSKVRFIIMIVLATIFVFSVSAQDDDIPVVAVLKFGDLNNFNLSFQGTMDMFEAYDFRDGENIEYIFGEGELQASTVGDLVQFALDQNPDVIITTSTSMLIAADELTREMDNPPVIIFNVVSSAVSVGVVQSPCLKPAHITGSTILPPYDVIMPQLLTMGLQINHIGVIYDPSEAQSVINVELIQSYADDLGLEIFAQTVNSPSVVAAVAEGMAGANVDAFLIPPDSTVRSALDSINTIADLAGIPVITVDSSQVADGATIGMGLDYYRAGVNAARLAIHYLSGNIDIATTAISNQTEMNIGINLDSVARQNLELSANFIGSANFIVENGVSSEVPPTLSAMTFEERLEQDTALLSDLYCSRERIAEETEALDQ